MTFKAVALSQPLFPPVKRIVLWACHEDRRYVQSLLVHFASCQQTSCFVVWDTTHIPAGSLWQEEIISHLAEAHIVIPLISADFLASPFFAQALPRLLEASYAGSLRILPVILRPCLFQESPLAPLQAANDPSKPLSLLSLGQRELLWVKLIRTILHLSSL